MADIVQSKKYDIRPFPKTKERRINALPAVVEAGVKQELFFLNSVYENVSDGILTEEQGKEIMWMLDGVNSVFGEAVDLLLIEDNEPLKDVLNECVIENFPINGVGVYSKKIIYESCKPDSVYADFGWYRAFREATDPLAILMNRRMDYLENEMYLFHESYGDRGFIGDNTIFYLESTNPDTEMFLRDYLETVTVAAAITDTIPAGDGVMILSFLESCFMKEFSVAAMAPVVPVEDEDILTKSPDKTHKMNLTPVSNAKEAASAINGLLNENGWYTMEAATVYKNNITFDSIARKLFNNLVKLIKLKDTTDPNASFKAGLNMKKDQYRFSFIDSDDPKIENTIRASILAIGFKPVKENGVVESYIMEKKPIVITVAFSGVDTGIDITYTNTATTESSVVDEEIEYVPIVSLEVDNTLKDQLVALCESTSCKDGYIDNFIDALNGSSTYTQVQNIKANWGEDVAISEACDVLMYAMESEEGSVGEDEINAALTVVRDVIFTETACTAVLDASDFTQEMMEASKADIDSEIKSIIELLNRLGYKTKYSSAGYREERSKDDRDKNGVYYGKLYTTARITFDGNYKFNKLPEGWYQNFNSDTTAIYVKPFTYDEKDGSPDEAFSKWKSKYIEALKDWAENLEDAKENRTTESTDAFYEAGKLLPWIFSKVRKKLVKNPAPTKSKYSDYSTKIGEFEVSFRTDEGEWTPEMKKVVDDFVASINIGKIKDAAKKDISEEYKNELDNADMSESEAKHSLDEVINSVKRYLISGYFRGGKPCTMDLWVSYGLWYDGDEKTSTADPEIEYTLRDDGSIKLVQVHCY